MTTKSKNTLDLPPTEPKEKTADDPVFADVAATEDMPSDDMPPSDDDFEFVRLPSGELRAVRKDQIRDVPMTATQDAQRTAPEKPKEEEHFYVHLSDGSVERVKESDVPGHAGMNAPNGFWQRDGKLYMVTGVYPAEVTVKAEE